MDRLTEKKYWNSVYEKDAANFAANFKDSSLTEKVNGSGWKEWLKRHIGEYWRDYSDFLEWEVIYSKYFPKQAGVKVIEIGSAPGENLVRLHKTFGYEPFGVEYAEVGAQMNRETFRKNGLNPNNVIQSDVFSEQFLSAHQGQFDLVISRGFIEHFTEMDKVLDAHLALLKEGGVLMISIPRLRAVPWLFFKFFNPAIIPMHNLEIMNKRPFRALFRGKALQELYCHYQGTLKIHVVDKIHLRGVKLRLMHLMMDAQSILYMLFRLMLGRRGFETYLFSPFLMYIGKKKST